MFKKSLILLVEIFFITAPAYSHCLLETEHLALSMDTYLRKDVVAFKNVVDLDSANSDDTTAYLGIDYNLGFNLEVKNDGPKFYLKLERAGPGDYDAPLFVHNTLMTSAGVIEEYRNDELLPNVEEFWLDTPLGNKLGLKTGLYAYEVGNGFSLNGSFENYGLTFYRETEDFSWRIYYCRPDVVYKNHLGPRIRQDEEQDYDYNHNAANFFALDVKFNKGKNYFQPYVGILADYTSPSKRNNAFTAPIKRDILGTFGLSWDLKGNKFSLKTEMAHNFGKAQSSNQEYKDIYHTGYLMYTDLEYRLKGFNPLLQFLLCSGNKVKKDMASDTTFTSSKNRAFSVYSPLNKNLDDTVSACHSEIRPIVAMGGGCALNYGVPRPRTFAVSDFDNIIIVSLGFNFEMTEKAHIGLFGYNLRAFEKPVGTLNTEAKYLSSDLGREVDLFIDYKINPHILLSLMGGYFSPGRYYREERDDTPGSLFNPFVRGDGDVDSAYQVELALEFSF